MSEGNSFSGGDDGPAILQLHKWRPSEVELLRNLSEFRNGFISPSRKLLLLLTYKCEALLLPLVKEKSRDNKDPENSCCEGVENVDSVASRSTEVSGTGRGAETRETSLGTSNRVEADLINDFTEETDFLGSRGCDFVSDVHSLAWGLCGDPSNEHEETSFRELLFVSGNSGVTVHAFCKPHRTSEVSRPVEECDNAQGMWVDWGPSLDDSRSIDSRLPYDGFGGASYESTTNAGRGRPCARTEASKDGPSSMGATKRWLRTFLTKAQSVKSDGQLYTRFPERSSFPSSAEVISFSIFGDDLSQLEFISCGNSVLHERESCDVSVLNQLNNKYTDSDTNPLSTAQNDCVSSALVTDGIDSSYKCFRVFSSNSYCLIGFAMELMDFVPINKPHVCERKNKTIIVVVRLVSWGVQWVCSVKLDEGKDKTEWTDFKLSSTYLICLRKSGLISFYGALSGEHIASVELFRICGFHHSLNSLTEEGSALKHNGDIIDHNKHDILCHETVDFADTGKFRSLLILSHSSLLGIVDEFGVVYVIPVDDHIMGKCNSFERPLPDYQWLGCGILAGWEAASGEIGCQSVNRLCNVSKSFPSRVNAENEEGSTNQESAIKKQRGPFNLYKSGLSSAVQVMDEEFISSDLSSNVLRQIFLPNDKFSEDDVICFSPFGITRLIRRYSCQKQKKFQLVHSSLFVDLALNDDRGYNMQGWDASTKEAVGCVSHGCLYLVTEEGLSVVLPAISVSSSFFPIEAIGYRNLNSANSSRNEVDNLLGIERLEKSWSPWKVEVLDRVLLFEGPEEADQLCQENGWDLRTSRIRRLQLALHYLKFEEIENSLEMLAIIHLAEEGILRLIFAAAYLMSRKVSNDNEFSAASRLLALATSFAIRMVRKYGLLHLKKDLFDQNLGVIQTCPILPNTKENDESECSRRMSDMAHFLEIIRDLQLRLNIKFKRPGHGLVDGPKALRLNDTDLMEDDSKNLVTSAEPTLLDAANNCDSLLPASENAEKMALIPMSTINNEPSLVSEGSGIGKRIFTLENSKDMIARWEVDDLDVKTIVRDALLSGRLPLAVLKLHLLRSQEFATEEETHNTFNEVRDVGRAIVYDFFLKGETSLAVTTLQKLGEDIETSLKQLLFGTLRRSLRMQIAEVMKTHGFLGPREWNILERISLIERVYPCSSFWNTFSSRWNELKEGSSGNVLEGINLPLLHPLHKDLLICCGEIDGVVLGSWTSIIGHPVPPEVDIDSSCSRYWTAAVVWSDAWDHLVIDRVVLDQPFVMGVNILWESQLEYYMGHNDWIQVSMLLEAIPLYALPSGALSIRLDSLQSTTAVEYGQGIADYENYMCSLDDLDAVCMIVPNIKIFRFPTNNMCSLWLRMLMEQQLAKRFVFLKDYWEGTAEIVHLLACSGFILDVHDTSSLEESIESSADLVISVVDGAIHPDAVLGLHKLFVQFCAQYNLLNLLDVYLDHHKLAVDQDSLSLVHDAAGDNLWAKWLLFQRVKGKEYEASFWNARAVASHNFLPSNNVSELDIDDMMRTVDDIAEGAGEMAALATLMYAPIPIQECLSSGSINRHFSSGQCTLENLRPALQRFPTLWRTLLAACFGQDPTCNMFGSKPKVSGYSDLLDYLNWRENIFFSCGRDTSLLQMLPCWFPKAVRRLIQLYVQGPLGWQSVADFPMGEYFWLRDFDSSVNSNDHSDMSAMSWEAAIQKHIEEELCASSSEETGLGLEHHLHRGRALAAFNHLLALRVEKLNSEERVPSGTSVPGQTNVQSDVHALLAPITQNEESLLSAVVPLAIVHFKDSVLVASCALLLELCGLSASILQIDIAALRRISSFYKSDEHKSSTIQMSPSGAALHTKSIEGDIAESLARALADDYLRNEYSGSIKQRDIQNNVTGKLPTRALMMVLQCLEKASLPAFADGMTCGSWLMTGNFDGAELRSQQKAASQKWNLVTVFCQLHQMPLSTKYLACLARDNDWIGFLSEAQDGGYPLETVIDIASKEFNDPRLKIHLLTVLKSMLSRKRVGSASNSETATSQFEAPVLDENLYAFVELFGIIAECEKLKNPGEALLLKAKNLRWSILAMVSACFPDVSPLSCLAVWLEITAARETSAIKVNDIASQIANNVGAAVEASNSLPATARAITFHYNRRTQKRRRLIEPMLENSMLLTAFDVSATSGAAKFEEIIAEEEREKDIDKDVNVSSSSDIVIDSLSRMVAVLCEQRLFLPLLRAFEIFLPSCSLLPFIRALQAFAQMRLSEASAHLGSFSTRIKEEPPHAQANIGREGPTSNLWISSTAVKAADAMLSTCPSPYEKRCLLQLLAATDFGDDGSAAMYYRRLYWKINLAEPSLRKDDGLHLGNETLDDASLLTALIKNGCWEQARNWARQLEASGGSWRSVVHYVTEMQAESMVAEWKEFLWDVPEERVALWGHCQTLFLRYSFPASQAGLFFLKHAEEAEKDLPARELHGLLLLSLQWLTGTITQSNQACPLNLLREIETKVWLLAVESEAQVKGEGELPLTWEPGTGKSSNIIDQTANVITNMDNHVNSWRSRTVERSDMRENNQTHVKTPQVLLDSNFLATTTGNTKTKRRPKGFVPSRRPVTDILDKSNESEGVSYPQSVRDDSQLVDENCKFEASISRWEERVGPLELERAVLSLMEFGQITAARQLQYKLSPGQTPSEFVILDAALKLAAISTPNSKISVVLLDNDVRSVLQSHDFLADYSEIAPLQVLEGLAAILTEGSGRGVCKRIISVVKAANVLGLSFSEAFEKQPIELLRLLTLKAQDSLEEANLLVQTHSMPAASIAQVLAESFLKGLLAAHRGGYMDSQKEEGPAPLLWRFSDFLKWAELCSSESEIGHALMRLVITGQEIPHACEVELLILSHHFYKSSACLDGVDVLVALAATRVEAYVSEGDFTCLARLITGVGNFHALNFILGILIENGQLDLLLQKYSAAADANTGTAEAVRGFRMAVLTSLQQFNPHDLDAFSMVYNHFDMKHETAALLESRAEQSSQQWFLRYDRDQTDDLLESMRYFIEAAEVHSSIDAGNKTRKACAQASLVSLQIRMPDLQWLNLSETNARRALVEQSRFQEALVVAEAYGLNQPSEWALVLWNQMLKPELTEQFVAEFVAVLPLQPSMLVELARFYRAEVAARGDQSHFSVWLTGGGLPAEWAKYLGRSFRCLLRRTRDLRLQLQLATSATGFADVIDSCHNALDKVPENAGPLVLRKGHGGAYLPLM